MASCDIQNKTAAVVCPSPAVSTVPLSVSPGRVPYYGSSLPERHQQALFQQQKQRALAARRSRATSWSHRLSHSFTLVSDDAISNFSQESLLSPRLPVDGTSELSDEDEVDLAPHRTFWQLFRNNMFQFGLELLYATETALVTPILLKLGLPDEFYSITWMISPILGFIFTPIVGSISDRCRSRWGRRRPFVLSFAIGMVIGLTLLLNGGDLGMLLGDTEDRHIIGLVVTLVGMFLMDFSSNSGDCPARAYLIDVCSIKDTEFALSLRTLLGGVGGGLGYILNGINWETTFLSVIGHQERIIFTMTGTLAIVSFVLNLFSIPEVPLDAIASLNTGGEDNDEVFDENTPLLSGSPNPRTKLMAGRSHLSSINDSMPSVVTGSDSPIPNVLMAPNGSVAHDKIEGADDGEPGSLKDLFLSIIYMPKELAHLCINHFLGWLSYLVVLLFFTDYMAQAVYKGDPAAPPGSAARDQYDHGVQIGCWGLCIFSFSCAVTAGIYSKLSPYLSHRTVYVFGQLFFAVCTGSMALVVDSPIATMVLCSSFGVQFFILLTMPSCLITVYHESNEYVKGKKGNRRGIGKDVGCIGVQIFIAQIIDSTIVGPLVILFGSHLVIVLLSSFLAFIAAIYSSLFVTYEIRPKSQKTDEERDRPQV